MENAANRINIVVMIGGVRPGNYTAKATALVVDAANSGLLPRNLSTFGGEIQVSGA